MPHTICAFPFYTKSIFTALYGNKLRLLVTICINYQLKADKSCHYDMLRKAILD